MKNRLVQIALSFALLGLVVQIVLIAPSQIRDTETKAAVLPTPEVNPGPTSTSETARDSGNYDQSMKGMHLIETQEGRKEYELEADKANRIKATEIYKLETVKAIFFSDNGVTFTVTGKHGTVEPKKNLRVEGDVVTRSSNGYTFKTESMEYDSKTRLLTAQNAVEMFGPKDADGHALHLTGIGMRASVATSEMEVLSDVNAVKGLDQGRKAFIKSRRSIFYSKDKSARFIDDVVLDMDTMRITGPEARFDYDAKTDLVKSIYVSGGAKVSDTDKWATANNVNIDLKQDKFTFRGNPRLVQNNDELRGQEIVFLQGGKQVQVQKAQATVDEKKMEKK